MNRLLLSLRIFNSPIIFKTKPKVVSVMSLHIKCRNNIYPRQNKNGEEVKRLEVPDEMVSWNVSCVDYDPPSFTMHGMASKPWADLDIGDSEFSPNWNELDGDINRKSHEGVYEICDEFPLNPKGRTGLKGRGCLGRWGPNHAADPVVTRWKVDENCEKVCDPTTEKPILQFVSIERHDSGDWAIPGGMVDPGEVITSTLQREFCEEALNSLSLSAEDREALIASMEVFFKSGKEIYRGYVDDPRNTDNSWMETIVYNFHDEDGTTVGRFPLEAGDDAANVKWSDIDQSLQLYASHSEFINAVVNELGAHW